MAKPNILVIIIDDLPNKVTDTMPFSLANIRDKGAIYPNGTIPTPLCAVSRTTFFTGRVTHNHGVWANTGPYGGWKGLAPYEPNALPVALHNVGYRTGLFGKYINQWNKEWLLNHTVPPGWDRFMAILADGGGDGAYYNYTLVGTEPDDHYGSLPKAYSTDVVSAKTAAFIAETPDTTPFFAYFAPYGSHAGFQPAPRHIGLYTPGPLNPAVNSDNSLRAPWLRPLPLVDEAKIRDIYEAQHECVMSVDEGVAQIFAAIGPTRLANTLILFFGDNGLQRGEQRLMGKNIGYPGSLGVPFMARWDGVIEANTQPPEIVTNADYTKTIVDAAGATMYGLDGMTIGARTSGVLIEGMADVDGTNPGWVGWKTRNWLYLNYGTGQSEELYKIICDPNAITNVASQYPDKVVEFKTKVATAANPLPPGFSY